MPEVLNLLWKLMEEGVEELKVLQCIMSLLSTTRKVKGELLSKAIVLCFRLHFTKDSTTNAIAAATLRQIVSLIFERVQREDIERGVFFPAPTTSFSHTHTHTHSHTRSHTHVLTHTLAHARSHTLTLYRA